MSNNYLYLYMHGAVCDCTAFPENECIINAYTRSIIYCIFRWSVLSVYICI